MTRALRTLEWDTRAGVAELVVWTTAANSDGSLINDLPLRIAVSTLAAGDQTALATARTAIQGGSTLRTLEWDGTSLVWTSSVGVITRIAIASLAGADQTALATAKAAIETIVSPTQVDVESTTRSGLLLEFVRGDDSDHAALLAHYACSRAS